MTPIRTPQAGNCGGIHHKRILLFSTVASRHYLWFRLSCSACATEKYEKACPPSRHCNVREVEESMRLYSSIPKHLLSPGVLRSQKSRRWRQGFYTCLVGHILTTHIAPDQPMAGSCHVPHPPGCPYKQRPFSPRCCNCEACAAPKHTHVGVIWVSTGTCALLFLWGAAGSRRNQDNTYLP